MNKLVVAVLVISIVGNLVGLFVLYKYLGARKSIGYVRQDLEKSNRTVGDLTGLLDQAYPNKMVFLHHSVGRGILYEGGLRDSLLELGILVKGATYGDSIGQKTDMNDWLPKFRRDLNKILDFKAHPDIFYNGIDQNDIVMFKSCFPNSDIVGTGTEPGNPESPEKTIANYQAVFVGLKAELLKQPNKLFIYLTAPPLVPSGTTSENAQRARQFNNWLAQEFLPSYRNETGLDNFAVFDLFNLLADEDGFLKAAYRRSKPGDSHPNVEANKIAAAKFMEFFRPAWENWSRKLSTSKP